MKHIKINLKPEEALEKLQNKEVLVAYTEGYEQDTRVRVYNEKNRLVLDYGDGRSEDHGVVITKRTKNPERVKAVLENIAYVIKNANKGSKADTYTIEINKVRDFIFDKYEEMQAFNLDEISDNTGLDMDDVEFYLDELFNSGQVSFNNDEYYYC